MSLDKSLPLVLLFFFFKVLEMEILAVEQKSVNVFAVEGRERDQREPVGWRTGLYLCMVGCSKGVKGVLLLEVTRAGNTRGHIPSPFRANLVGFAWPFCVWSHHWLTAAAWEKLMCPPSFFFLKSEFKHGDRNLWELTNGKWRDSFSLADKVTCPSVREHSELLLG